ncbi:fatty acyl-AMP ligase [Streptomyces wedmorensis]|uniref:fatty acyl-AMP ligase n=1 Tax=Streptomyces wedmorensis TaxID=43759 RepID=UPI0037B08E5A
MRYRTPSLKRCSTGWNERLLTTVKDVTIGIARKYPRRVPQECKIRTQPPHPYTSAPTTPSPMEHHSMNSSPTAEDVALPQSVMAAFDRLRLLSPDRELFTFVDDDGHDTHTVTAGSLSRAAAAIGYELTARGLRQGDRVLLCYPPGSDFTEALTACLWVGLIPVPVYPPNPLKLRYDVTALTQTAQDCGAVAVLTNTSYDRARTAGRIAGNLSFRAVAWPALPWYRTDRCRPAATDSAPAPVIAESSATALLQYTSGSTGTPKGVIISHGNLWHEIQANAVDLGLGEAVRGVFWLPQYHDFGLISVILSTLTGNSRTYLMSPLTFLHQPSVWFDVMARVRATHTAAPNFAFEVAVRRTDPEQRARWDLSSLRAVMWAAEPIRPATVDRFYRAFATAGLSPDTLYPAYGLAEHSVSVTMGGTARVTLDRAALDKGRALPLQKGQPGADGAPGAEYVSCGRVTKPGAVVAIVTPDTGQRCGPNDIGEIWVDSPTKALGYWGRPEESAAVFEARLQGTEDDTRYLRTGDLGFFHEGELYVTGRHKDLIILGGHNLYPQDIEDSVRDCHQLVRPGSVAAFALGAVEHLGTEERLVVFVETTNPRASRPRLEELAATVRKRVREDHGMGCDVVVGAPGLVLKTTSGKVRRSACRAAYARAGTGSPPTALLVSRMGIDPDPAATTAGAVSGPGGQR